MHRLFLRRVIYLGGLCLLSRESYAQQSLPLSSRQACVPALPAGGAVAVSSANDRVVNGILPTGELEKYMVSITNELGDTICSGSLISEHWVLTSAWCPVHPGADILRAGGLSSSEGRELAIAEIFQHPSYDLGKNYFLDVQLIRLADPAPTGSQYVRLNSNASIPSDFSFVRAAGYGLTLGSDEELGKLFQVDLPVQPVATCQEQLEMFDVQGNLHICAGFNAGGCNVCFGDVGGPLFLFDGSGNIVQVGIISFGKSCDEPESPSGYIRISSYLEWLDEIGVKYSTSNDGQSIFERQPNAPSIATPPPPLFVADESGPTVTGDSDDTEDPFSTPASDLLDSDPSATRECFPASGTVLLDNGMILKMEELQVGDRVKVGVDEYSEVFMFTHREHQGGNEFIELHSSSLALPLALSRGHLLYVNNKLLPAYRCRVGDTIQLGCGGTARIQRKTVIQSRGLFNPQTLDGRIVVNGVVASTYTAAVVPETAHALLSPLRYVFHALYRFRTGGISSTP